MHPGIAIPVGDVELPGTRIERHMRTAMKRLSTHKGRGLPRDTQGEEHLALQGALADGVITVVGTKHRGIGTHGNTMGARKHPCSPVAWEMPLPVENHHWMRPTVKA